MGLRLENNFTDNVVVSLLTLCRSSCPEVLYDRTVLKNFITFSGKLLWQISFYSKVAGLYLQFYNEDPIACFSGECCEIFRTAFHRTLFCWQQCIYILRGESRTAATSKIEHFVIIVNGWNPVNYYHKELHLGCWSSPRSASDSIQHVI